MRKVVSLIALAALAACGGTGSGRAYLGGIIEEADINGNFVGVPPEDVQIVRDGVNAVAFGFSRGLDATVVGNSYQASSGDTGNFGVAGIVPGYDVGEPILSGSASLTGDYAFTKITGYEDTSNAANWTEEEFAGSMAATITFDREEADISDPEDPSTAGDVDVYQNDMILTGESVDGRFVVEESPIYDLLNQRDLSAPSVVSDLNITVDGQALSPRNEVVAGQRGVVAAFAGSQDNTIITGGFVLGRDN
ncbi:MAG: hypothetical protein ABJO29_07890 [Yoonia sp.]|uniref:hypothetical protein n=1 Tax=Yoonia sp. TaxID=2212373 RepID=UPI0032673703